MKNSKKTIEEYRDESCAEIRKMLDNASFEQVYIITRLVRAITRPSEGGQTK